MVSAIALDVLTVDFAVVAAAVKEYPDSVFSSIAYIVLVDLDVVAPLGGDDTCGHMEIIHVSVWVA